MSMRYAHIPFYQYSKKNVSNLNSGRMYSNSGRKTIYISYLVQAAARTGTGIVWATGSLFWFSLFTFSFFSSILFEAFIFQERYDF